MRSEHLLWCRRRESNPHGCIPADFKSAASACSATPTSFNFVWWNQRESNPQPPACKAGALPIELCSQIEAKYRGVAPRNSSLFVPSRNLSARDFKHLVHVFGLGAGDGNRTRIPSLEGWCPDHCATPAYVGTEAQGKRKNPAPLFHGEIGGEKWISPQTMRGGANGRI